MHLDTMHSITVHYIFIAVRNLNDYFLCDICLFVFCIKIIQAIIIRGNYYPIVV